MVFATPWCCQHQQAGKVSDGVRCRGKIIKRSLNSNLSTGPDLLNSFLGVLLRIRNLRVAVIANVEAMFH